MFFGFVYIYIYIIYVYTRNHIRNSAAPNTHPDNKPKMQTDTQNSQAQQGSETDRFIVYNQSEYCSFWPRVSGSTPGAGKCMPAGMPEQACLQECLNSKSISSLPATASPLFQQQHEHLLSGSTSISSQQHLQQQHLLSSSKLI